MAGDEQRSQQRRHFSEQRYAAAFGRYEGTRDAAYPAHELLVGRDGERARFLNLLLAFGRRGAFLITGHRGSGKTTFVNYCLEEYTNNVFRRYLRSNVGRAFFWDRLGHLIVGLLVIALFLLMTENLQELALLPWHGLLDWLWMGVLALFCCYPLLKSKELLSAALCRKSPWDRTRDAEISKASSTKPELLSILILGLAGAVLVLRGSLGSAALAVSQLVTLAGVIYLIVNFFSIGDWAQADDLARDDPSYTLAPAKGSTEVLTYGLVLIAGALILFWPMGSHGSDGMVICNWLLGLLGLALGALRRAVDQWRISRQLACGGESPPSAAAAAVAASAFWHAVGSVVILTLVGIGAWAAWSQKAMPQVAGRLIATLLSVLGVLSMLSSIVRSPNLGLKVGVIKSLVLLKWWSPVSLRKTAPNKQAPKQNQGDSSSADLGLIARLAGLVAVWIRTLREKAQTRKASTSVDGIPQKRHRTPGPVPLALLHARPGVLLAWKALAFLAVGLQVAYPLALAAGGGVARTLGLVEVSSPLSLVRSLTAADLASQVLFPNSRKEVLWLAGLVLLVGLCVFMEYEWVVRPYALVREDEATYWQDQHGAISGRDPKVGRLHRGDRRQYQRLAEQTFFWKTFTSWLPVLVIPVNLGFDVLEYRVVIEAMLAGLKEHYYQSFLHWSQPLVVLRRWLTGVILIWIAFYAADRWFAPESSEKWLKRYIIPPVVTMLYSQPLNKAGRASQTSLAGGAHRYRKKISPPTRLDKLTEISRRERQGLMINRLSGLNGYPPRLGSVYLYHLLTLLAFYVVAVSLSRVLPVAPYRSTYQRISRILDSLSSRLKEESKRSLLMRIGTASGGGERTEGKESGPFDPRTVELAFLQVLADCQNASLHLPFTKSHRISPPLPEIIFVFDELDKLGDRPGGQVTPAQKPAGEAPGVGSEFLIDRERERTRAIRRLFADLKNILSSALARFIFIGGRNLHDEWLADQSARTPLLSGTFSAEIHISSLLTDPVSGDARLGLTGIRGFLLAHWRRARSLHESWKYNNAAPWLWLSVEERRQVSFVQGEDDGAAASCEKLVLQLRNCDDGEDWGPSALFKDAFIDFLGYKSRGNVKQLNALLESFLRPVGRHVLDPKMRAKFDCENILLFRDIDRFRIQLIADVFNQLLPILKERLAYKDDKLGPGVLYLSEFLLKFHRRAFSWSNLGRVDELVHIHHSPDLRAVLEDIVLNWSEKYLHLINNGMYDYRFESQFARELEYLSHHSEQDLAAFNFTLDEAQALKATYAAQLNVSQEAYASDLLIGLGELHEFDEDFETARYYFRRAMRVLDKEFRFQAGSGGDPPLSFKLEAHTARGYEAARRVATWGVARVRLMLQVAMTYEKALDAEHARIGYRDARTLASAIVGALLGWKDGEQRIKGEEWTQHSESLHGDLAGYIWMLKNLSILFHPIFAEAWLAEKSVSGPDTSQSLLERELWELRRELPFVSSALNVVEDAYDPVSVQHSNFALTMAELHNRAGSLYFFKGRQLVPVDKIKESKKKESEKKESGDSSGLAFTEGYLLKAASHYSICLHEIRRFNCYRRKSSIVKLSDGRPREATIGLRSWPEFVYRVASGTMSNFAETLIARVSLVELLRDLGGAQEAGVANVEKIIRELYQAIAGWLEWTSDEPKWGELVKSVFPCCAAGPLDDWFGKPADQNRARQLITVTTNNSAAERLVNGIIFSLASGHLLEEAGYLAGASQEYLRVAGTVSQYLWWLSLLFKIEKRSVPEASEAGEWKREIATALTAAAKAHSKIGLPDLVEGLLGVAHYAIEHSRELEERRYWTRSPRHPSAARLEPYTDTAICSLALSAAALDPWLGESNLLPWLEKLKVLLRENHVAEEAAEKIQENVGKAKPAPDESKGVDVPTRKVFQDVFRKYLIDSLGWHSYPLNNRLCGLKLLIDDGLLRDDGPQAGEIAADIEELMKLDTLYNSPLHFTPLQSGLTLAMAYLFRSHSERATNDEIYHVARHKLKVSQQLYTMQRSYYEMISDLYYLYDDFNDRTIHYNQCIQMAGTELASYMIALLDASPPRAPKGATG